MSSRTADVSSPRSNPLSKSFSTNLITSLSSAGERYFDTPFFARLSSRLPSTHSLKSLCRIRRWFLSYRDRFHGHYEASSLALTDPKEPNNFGLRQAISSGAIAPTHPEQKPCLWVSAKVLDQELRPDNILKDMPPPSACFAQHERMQVLRKRLSQSFRD